MVVWHTDRMGLLAAADYDPLDTVSLTQVRTPDGEPTGWVEIEGLRQGGMRTRIVAYTRPLEQADLHWEIGHEKTRDDPQSADEFAHAMMRAAVAFLMD